MRARLGRPVLLGFLVSGALTGVIPALADTPDLATEAVMGAASAVDTTGTNAHSLVGSYLAGRFALRHRVSIAMASVVIATMAAGLVIAERERRVAVAEKARADRHAEPDQCRPDDDLAWPAGVEQERERHQHDQQLSHRSSQ